MHTPTSSSALFTVSDITMEATTLTQVKNENYDMAVATNEPTPICCCSFLDESLGPDQHLVDCELLILAGELILQDSPSDSSSSGRGSPGPTRDSAARRRRHRESMARLRQKLRESIGTLQLEQQQLVATLQRTVAAFPPQYQESNSATTVDARFKLRLAYFELVKEQLALQDERDSLDDTWAKKAAYERLVHRELQRMKEATMTTMNGGFQLEKEEEED